MREKTVYFLIGIIIGWQVGASTPATEYFIPETDSWVQDHPWLNPEMRQIIKNECQKHGIDPALVAALIKYESARHCKNNLSRMLVVRSRSGAVGIMQIMPIHANLRGIPVSDLERPDVNIQIGVAYLARMIEIAKRRGYADVYAEALRCYNQGPALDRYAERHRGRYRGWTGYVEPIMATWRGDPENIYVAVR